MNRLKTPARLLALFACSLALHLCGTWILPLVDRDEPRFAEAAREMRQRGDWVLPTFNDQPRYDKPPLTYWLQIGAFAIFGENEFAARFHSALCSALTVLVIFGFCARLYGERTAWCAALAFTLCLQVFVQSKAAVADMPMVLFVTVAAWAGWELCESNARGVRSRWWWIFHGALALGFLVKGPVAFLPLAWLLLYARLARVGNLNRRFLFLPGAVGCLLILAAWGIPALVKTHGDFLRVGIGHHVIARSFTPLEGHGGRGWLKYVALLPFYFVTVFASFLPWSFELPRALLDALTQRSRPQLYLLGGIAVTFVVFSLLATKLPHYTLPAFPLLACLVAPRLAARPAFFRAAVPAMILLNLLAALEAFPVLAGKMPERTLVARLAPRLHPGTQVALVDYSEPGLVWYLRGHIATWPETISSGDLSAWLAQPGDRLCIRADGPPADLGVTGWNPATGKTVTLSAVGY